MKEVIFSAIMLFSFLLAQFRVNEIMYKPSTGNPEWFEIVNISTEPETLAGWYYSDMDYSATLITSNPVVVPPGGFVIIADTTWSGFGTCNVILPAVWRALSNSSDDGIRLWRPDMTLVDSATYSVSIHNCGYGVSVERIYIDRSSTDPANWACSTDPDGSTPCERNSVAMESYPVDLSITSISLDPANPLPDQSFTASVTIQNNGTETAAAGFILTFRYISASETTTVGTRTLPSMASGATLTEAFSLSLPAGSYTLLASINDTIGTNNTFSRTISIIAPGETPRLKISEIMFKPTVSSHEWVEIYNAGLVSCDIMNWMLADHSYTGRITTVSTIIEPGEYFILAEFETTFSCRTIYMSGWPWLNNDGDSIFLRAADSSLVDVAVYTAASSWSHDVSAERINISSAGDNTSNWAASRDASGSTPCAENSVIPVEPGTFSIEISPNPFDPELENTSIKVTAAADATVELRIYDLNGKLIRDFGNTFSTTWDGRNTDGDKVPAGPYIVMVKEESGGKVRHRKAAIAVARGMR